MPVFPLLHLLPEQIPRQKPQAQFPLTAHAQREQIDGVNDLRLRDMDVDGAEILRQTVAHEDDAEVEQDPEFLVGGLEGDEVMLADAAVEVAWRNARVGRQVVDYGLVDGDVVVDEGEARVGAGAAADRDAGKAQARGPDGLAGAVGAEVDFGFGESDEFGVDGHGDAGGWGFDAGGERAENVG